MRNDLVLIPDHAMGIKFLLFYIRQIWQLAHVALEAPMPGLLK